MEKIDWELCCICQEDTGRNVRCPLATKARCLKDNVAVYESFLCNESESKEIDKLPVALPKCEGIQVDDLVNNHGVWHHNCYMNFSNAKHKRAKENHLSALQNESNSNKRSLKCKKVELKKQCLFCGEEGDNINLQNVETFSADYNIKTWLRTLVTRSCCQSLLMVTYI